MNLTKRNTHSEIADEIINSFCKEFGAFRTECNQGADSDAASIFYNSESQVISVNTSFFSRNTIENALDITFDN